MRPILLLCTALAAVGCAATTEEETEPSGEQDQETTVRYDRHDLMTDEEMRGGQSITAAQVQSFLDDQGSYLAQWKDSSGRSAAQLIVAQGREHRINPIYLLARIQVESSLIGSGTSRNLSAATGCACPDGRGCSRVASGFQRQVACAAEYIEDYYEEMSSDGETRAGWAVGRTKRSLDGCSVTPRNKATAALYTYTPWVGKRGLGCGAASVSGSTMLVQIFDQYKNAF